MRRNMYGGTKYEIRCLSWTSLQNRGKRPVYKGCQILVREVGVKSASERRQKHDHKPDDWRTYRLFNCLKMFCVILSTWQLVTSMTACILLPLPTPDPQQESEFSLALSKSGNHMPCTREDLYLCVEEYAVASLL